MIIHGSRTSDEQTMNFIFSPTQTKGCYSGKGLIDGRRLLCEGARAVLGDIHTVFQTNAELAVNGDHRLIAKGHTRLQLQLVAAYQVGPLVNIQADSVTGPMR